MHDRIKKVRQQEGMTQGAFAEIFRVSENYVWMIENGKREPSTRLVKQMCERFGISEQWLLTGEGDMLVPRTRKEEIADFLGRAIAGETTPLQDAFITTLASLTIEQLEVLATVAEKLVEAQKKEGQ